MNTTFPTLALFLALALSGIASSQSAAANPDSPSYDAALEEIDRHFKALRYEETEAALKSALKTFPNDAGLLWRYCSLMLNWGDGVRDDKREEEMYKRSVEYGEAAIKADPKDANAHSLLAAAYGSYAMFVGGKEKVKLANKIKDQLDISLKLDPKNEVAHTVYGTWHREVADVGWIERQLANMFLGGLPDGSFEKSVYHFKEAIKVNPDFLRHHFQLGLTYLAMEKEDLAVKAWKKALSCPASLKADIGRKKRIKELIAEYSD
ncbi:MAG: hypothetical protein CL946_10280 [Ectothiorhodospiraceae bacterium]|nr:hypothetical protein [Ectothiorhodospiraceae bacterium]